MVDTVTPTRAIRNSSAPVDTNVGDTVRPPSVPSSSSTVSTPIGKIPVKTTAPNPISSASSSAPSSSTPITPEASSAKKSTVKRIEDEIYILHKIFCLPILHDTSTPSSSTSSPPPLSKQLSINRIRDILDERLMNNEMNESTVIPLDNIVSSSLPGIRASLVYTVSTLPALDYLVFLYNHCAEVCQINGPVKGITNPSSSSSSTTTTTTNTNNGALSVTDKVSIGKQLMEAIVDYIAILLGMKDMYEPLERIFRRGTKYSLATVSGVVEMDIVQNNNNNNISSSSSSSTGTFPNETDASKGIWSLLLAATEFRNTSRFSTAGAVEDYCVIPLALLQDIVYQLDSLVGKETLVQLVTPISWRILRGAQANSSFHSPERSKVLSVLQTLVLCKPLACALVQTSCFTGHYTPETIAEQNNLIIRPKYTVPTSFQTMPGGRITSMVQHVLTTGSMFIRAKSLNEEDGQHYQHNTILGCLLSPSVLPPEPPSFPGGMNQHSASLRGLLPSSVFDQFANVEKRSKAETAANIMTIQGMQNNIIDTSHTVIRELLRADTVSKNGDKVPLPSAYIVREAVLKWVREVLSVNATRSKEYSEGKSISDDGFMLNLCMVLFRLCDPIITGTQPLLTSQSQVTTNTVSSSSSSSSVKLSKSVSSTVSSASSLTDKVSLIDPQYLQSPDCLIKADLPKLIATATTTVLPSSSTTVDEDLYGDGGSQDTNPLASSSSSVQNNKSEADFAFITRIFFYTIEAMRLGLGQIILRARQEDRMINNIHYHMRNRNDEDFRSDFEYRLANKVACDAVRLDIQMLSLAIRVSALIAEWTGRICATTTGTTATNQGDDNSAIIFQLPFPSQPSPLVKFIPEEFISIVVDILAFVGSAWDVIGNKGSTTSGALALLADHPFELPTVLSFFTALLASPKKYIRSPHLRAQIGDAIYGLFVPLSFKPGENDNDGNRSNADPAILSARHIAQPTVFVAQYLAPALMELYGDVEATGFYEKTTHRMKVAAILNYIWTLPSHRQAFHSIADGHYAQLQNTTTTEAVEPTTSSSSSSAFVSFANGIIGHTTSVLTEALKGLPVIRSTLQLMSNLPEWNAFSDEERERRSSQLDDTVSLVKNSLLLASQTTPLLAVLTEDSTIAKAFMRGELVGRLTAMLIQGVTDLGGPKGIQLKVDNPEQYNFRPKELLKDLLITILHLGKQDIFIKNVAECGLWKAEAWDKVAGIVERIQLLPSPSSMNVGSSPRQPSLNELKDFIVRVNGMMETLEDEKEALNDVPEEFMDPLLCTIMRDPVKVPSGYVYDRDCILQQILNNPVDPFTRAPLTVNDLVPHTELKERIDTWVKERLQTRKNKGSNVTTSNEITE